MLASMRDWLGGDKSRVVVVHCKAGKGRSGTASCSYLIAEQGWKMEEAIQRFTQRRMKPGWGAGVSIPSQLRTLQYVEKWTRGGKKYVERRVQVCEVHVRGLRDGVSVSIRGFIEEGKVIKVLHTFTSEEREVVNGKVKTLGFAEAVMGMMGREESSTRGNAVLNNDQKPTSTTDSSRVLSSDSLTESPALLARSKMEVGTPPSGTSESSANLSSASSSKAVNTPERSHSQTGADAIFRPRIPIVTDTNDINIDFERRTKGAYTWTVTTSIAHVWFNTFFEGNGADDDGVADDSGVFEIEWDKMDGIKGSSRKGARAFDRISIVWRAVEDRGVVEEPAVGEGVKQKKAADWRQDHEAEESSDEVEVGVKPHTTRE